jgi:hypothetical protein
MTEEGDISGGLPAVPGRRVWLRAEWGFDPEEGGYLGFTLEGNRTRFISEFREGDLVLIYGADQKQTRRDQRRQLLGFLEVEPIPITDAERSSEADRRRKIENGWQERWTYGVPVKRAWRVNRRIEAQHLARHTFETHNPILIASRCELLTPEEAAATLALPVTPVNVFGEPPLSPEQLIGEVAMRSYFEPSRGVTPNFGNRTFSIEDAENQLYVLKLEGDPAAFLGRPRFEVGRKAIVKVGHAKDPQLRCDAHNAHLPPACAFRWRVELKSPAFPGGAEAKKAEDALKQKFAATFESLGGEFFLGDYPTLVTEFTMITRELSFVIAAS